MKDIGKVFVSIFTYFLILSSILLLVISGVGYHYFSNEILIINPKNQLSILFGVGIGVGLLFFFGQWLFLLVPKFICNYIVTFPSFIIINSVYIYFCLPKSTAEYMELWNNRWNNTIDAQKLQMTQNCCGWFNYSDRGLEPCPFTFQSGCSSILKNYLEIHFNQLLIASIVTLSLGILSILTLVSICCVNDDDDFLGRIEPA